MKPVPARLVAALLAAAALLPVPAMAENAPGRTAVAIVGDSLAAFEASGRWREAEAASAALAESLAGPPVRDSLALLESLVRHARAMRMRGRTGDGAWRGDIARASAIGERLGPRADLALCQAWSVAAVVLVDLFEGDSALAYANRAMEIARARHADNDSLIGALYFREGQAHRAREDYGAGVRAFRASRERTARRLGPNAEELGPIDVELGRVFTGLGEFDSARVALERAVAIAQANAGASPMRLEQALSGLATLERRAGNTARAVELCARVCELYEAREGEDGPFAVNYRVNLASALLALGDHGRARSLYERSLADLSRKYPPTYSGLLQARIALAQACTQLGDYAAAREQLDRADSALATTRAKNRTLAAYSAAVRTGLELAAGEYAEARRQLLATTRDGTPALVSQVDLVARLYQTVRTAADRPLADSLGRVADAWAETTSVASLKNWPFALVFRARAEGRLGMHEAAWAHACRAESLEHERFRWEIKALPDRSALLHDLGAADPSRTLVDLARPESAGEVREAWAAVVRRRGAVREAVEARRRVFSPSDTALAGAHARWVAASRRHAQQLVAGMFDGGEPGARERFEASRLAAEEAERRYSQLAAPLGRKLEPASLERVLARLKPGEALVAYVVTEEEEEVNHLVAFVARGGEASPALVRLGGQPLVREAVEAWRELLSSPPPAEPGAARKAEAAARRAGDIVRRDVWDPLRSALGGATDVRLVAAGPLFDLPWLALPMADGRYLAEGGPRVTVLSAERDLLLEPADSSGGALLAIGDPDFDGPQFVTANLRSSARHGLPGGCTAADQHLARLPGARAEATAITNLWRNGEGAGSARLLTGADATEERFKALAPGCSVIHLATHGVLTRDSCALVAEVVRGVGGVAALPAHTSPKSRREPAPATGAEPAPSPWIGRDAWLAFAGANRVEPGAAGGDDGWLTADEVVTLDLRGTRRVVLSACQSGVADRWTQEAVLGLRRAFHLAGARCVIASQWAIADEATRDWMEAFYASRAADSGGALREAGRTVLASRRARGLSTHPFYWAAFTATGE